MYKLFIKRMCYNSQYCFLCIQQRMLLFILLLLKNKCFPAVCWHWQRHSNRNIHCLSNLDSNMISIINQLISNMMLFHWLGDHLGIHKHTIFNTSTITWQNQYFKTACKLKFVKINNYFIFTRCARNIIW
jgi:hypothetical protein